MTDDAPRDYSLFGDEHIAKYEATDGEVGYLWNGAPCLVLHTTGRKTGELRKFPLIFGERRRRPRAGGIEGRRARPPRDWYLNLVAHPDAAVQVKGDVIPVRARTAEGDERQQLWDLMLEPWPDYDGLPGAHRSRDPGRGARATLTRWATTTPSTAIGSAQLFDLTERGLRRHAEAGSRPIRIPRSTGCVRADRCTRASSVRSSASRATVSSRASRTRTVRTGRRSTGRRATPCSATASTFGQAAARRTQPGLANASILYMDGERAPALPRAGATVVPAQARAWWTERGSVDAIDALLDRMGPTAPADLNVEFFSAIPLLTITGSFGVSVAEPSTSAQRSPPTASASRRSRASCRRSCEARRDDPRDDLISVLVAAEITEEDGSTHRLTDEEVLIFAFLLLAAGSGTTWKQMGITMLALFAPSRVAGRGARRPRAAAAGRRGVAAVDADRPDVQPLRRWRHRPRGRRPCPRGPSMHMCLAAANRDPRAVGASRRVRPRAPGASPHGLRRRPRTSASVRTWPAPRSSP